MSALQWIVKEAKSLKKSYPKRFTKWTDYVKQASAIYASKHNGKSPVGKKKAVKKITVKKATKKKIGSVHLLKPIKKNIIALENKIIEQKNYNKIHKDKKLDAIIEMNQNTLSFMKECFVIDQKKKLAKKKVGVIKKKVLHSPLKKKAVKKPISTHKDTKSHNVNIKVVSGIGNIAIEKYKKVNSDIIKLENALAKNIETSKKFQYKTPFWKKYFLVKNKKIKSFIKELKTHARELKKHI